MRYPFLSFDRWLGFGLVSRAGLLKVLIVLIIWILKVRGFQERCIAEIHEPFIALDFQLGAINLIIVHLTVIHLFLLTVVIWIEYIPSFSCSAKVYTIQVGCLGGLFKLIDNWGVYVLIAFKYLIANYQLRLFPLVKQIINLKEFTLQSVFISIAILLR